MTQRSICICYILGVMFECGVRTRLHPDHSYVLVNLCFYMSWNALRSAWDFPVLVWVPLEYWLLLLTLSHKLIYAKRQHPYYLCALIKWKWICFKKKNHLMTILALAEICIIPQFRNSVHCLAFMPLLYHTIVNIETILWAYRLSKFILYPTYIQSWVTQLLNWFPLN